MSEVLRAPQTARHLADLQRMVRGEIPAPPIATLIGFAITEVELGRAIAEMDADTRHANPMGTLHGGVIADLSDAAMGVAMASTLEPDESFTTLDFTVKFFKPIWKAHLRASATVTKRTRSLGFIECDVLDQENSVVAKVFSSCMVLRGDAAKGR